MGVTQKPRTSTLQKEQEARSRAVMLGEVGAAGAGPPPHSTQPSGGPD